MHRCYDEFSITLRWKQPERGSYPRVDVPGFYLTAGWSNEAVADFPIDNYRLSVPQFQQIMAGLDLATGCAGTFADATRSTAQQAEDAIEARKQALRDSIARHQAQLSELEQQ